VRRIKKKKWRRKEKRRQKTKSYLKDETIETERERE
jgi:hypothetical protein